MGFTQHFYDEIRRADAERKAQEQTRLQAAREARTAKKRKRGRKV